MPDSVDGLAPHAALDGQLLARAPDAGLMVSLRRLRSMAGCSPARMLPSADR